MKILIAALLLISHSALATDFPDNRQQAAEINSDSGIRGPAYATIVSELQSLELNYPSIVEVHNYGNTVGGRPLALIKIAKKKSTSTLPAIYIGGSIHGDEYLNIEDRLPRWFVENDQSPGVIANYLQRGGAIYIAPILNPDGYDRRRRENNNGVDLNRDFTVRAAQVEGFKQPETTLLINFLTEDLTRTNRTLGVAMDYHCCIGALLYPWSFTGVVLPAADKVRHETIAHIMQRHLGTGVRYGTTPVILGYSAKGTSKDFYYERFGAAGFTYEGRRGQENRYLNEHTLMWNAIVEKMLE